MEKRNRLNSVKLKAIIAHFEELKAMNLKLTSYDDLLKDERFKNVKKVVDMYPNVFIYITFDFQEIKGTIDHNGLSKWFNTKLPNGHEAEMYYDLLEERLENAIKIENTQAKIKAKKMLINNTTIDIEDVVENMIFIGVIDDIAEFKTHAEFLKDIKEIISLFKKVPTEIKITVSLEGISTLELRILASGKTFIHNYDIAKEVK